MQFPSVFDNNKRYIFSNWSKEDFTATWEGSATTVKAGETKEFPEYLAYHFTKHFVDREMLRDKKDSMMAVDEARKPYEDKTMTEITGDTDSPALSALNELLRKEMSVSSVDPSGKTEETEEEPKKGSSKTATKEFAAIKQ